MMTAIVPITEKPIDIQDLIMPGKKASTTSVSRENLLTILPKGVVSKKETGSLKIL
jgi:hypothetical protein